VTEPFAATERIALPAGQLPVTTFCLFVSTVVNRASFALTVFTIVVKLPFTSEAFAGVPAVNVVSGPTGAALAAEAPTASTITERLNLRVSSFPILVM
jgi:hypothetical protein